MSANFAVRESAAYALVRAHVALGEGKPAEAIRLLQGAMGLPGVKRQLSDVGRSAAIMCMRSWSSFFLSCSMPASAYACQECTLRPGTGLPVWAPGEGKPAEAVRLLRAPWACQG